MSRQAAKELSAELGRSPGQLKGRRVVVAGKGGVGKTTLAASLCLAAAAGGRRVLALDQDVQQNLAYSLGYPPGEADGLRPITDRADYIEQKTGARPGGQGGLVSLNPDVSDVIERFGVDVRENLGLLVMGGVVHSSTGCLCPENALLGALVRFVETRDEDLVVMDAQAGMEPFGRSVTQGFDTALVVAEATFNSLKVAERIAALSRELGMEEVDLVLNKVYDPVEVEAAAEMLPFEGFDHVYALPYDPTVRENEPDLSAIIGGGGPYSEAVRELLGHLD